MLKTSRWTSRLISEAYKPIFSPCRSFTFQVNDRVLIEERREGRREELAPKLSKPLRHGRVHVVGNGSLQHSDIIGKRDRDVITIRKSKYRLTKPTLEEYITNVSRVVTPIYPQDANVILSHLDIHVGPPGSAHESEAPLEIFEAGTGHGGLTLHLARAIHAANPAAPRLDVGDVNEDGNTPRKLLISEADNPGPAPFPESWRAQRKAIIHSLDIARHHSHTARGNVRGFGRGIYAGNVDFYIGTIPDWFNNQKSLRFSSSEGEYDRTYLRHGILDLPDCDEYMGIVGDHLQVGGKLLVFCPSITQLIECNRMVRLQKLPLYQEKILELGQGMSGGRHWDVRAFKPRALAKAEQNDAPDNAEASEIEANAVASGTAEEVNPKSDDVIDDAGLEMICRPTAWKRVIGGGFLGVWTKTNKALT